MYYKVNISGNDVVCTEIKIVDEMLELYGAYYTNGQKRIMDSAHISNIKSMIVIDEKEYDRIVHPEIKVQLGFFTAIVSKDGIKLEGTNYRDINFPLESISALQDAVETIVFNQKK